MKIEEPFIIKQISQFKDEYKKLSLDKIKNELFDEDERHIYNKVIKSVRHFYKINNITENDQRNNGGNENLSEENKSNKVKKIFIVILVIIFAFLLFFFGMIFQRKYFK